MDQDISDIDKKNTIDFVTIAVVSLYQVVEWYIEYIFLHPFLLGEWRPKWFDFPKKCSKNW